jgi:hypothetical protein
MGQSYRIRTELGVNKTINVQLDQQFEFLEVLSLTLQQEDVYVKSCEEYGVVVGRVTANNGFGLPNARVAIFIPIESVDQSNPLISSIYPYKSPNDRNEDGYRYNLLPYEKSYSTHAATGTLPTRLDALTGNTAVEIYDKYYKFSSKTNESGDYMIMGVPQGNHSLVMDVDLSDIGEISLTPQDLIRMGRATESQVAGNRFRTSTDLNSLPQIINIVKSVEVSPLWGDPELCDIAINRVDFDLRDDVNIDIQPTAVFMGSIFSSPDNLRVRGNNKPKDNMGNLCGLVAGPGQILAIRQTIDQDSDGNPVLEQYQLEQSGNIIDGSGVWLTELPMNLDYFITNEFGEKVLSNDPTVGIPTKAKYRFKIKWQQSPTLTEQTRRPYFLVPNVKEYGWVNSSSDPLNGLSTSNKQKLASSYYFGLSWSGYTDGFTGTDYYDRLNEVIDCDDTFYEFNFNKVYTVSQLVDEYKRGGRGRFIGIKEINDNSCESTVNKFPVNEGFRNFDLLYFLFSFIFQIIQLIGLPLIFIARVVLFLYSLVIKFFCLLCGIGIPLGFTTLYPFGWICSGLNINCDTLDTTMALTMLTYPDCDTCECTVDVNNQTLDLPKNPNEPTATGFLSYVSYPPYFFNSYQNFYKNLGTLNSQDIDTFSTMTSIATAGFAGDKSQSYYKVPVTDVSSYSFTNARNVAMSSKNLPLGERINIFNQRNSFFSGVNKIKVTFAENSNIGKSHFDNTITVLANTGITSYNAGDLITFVSPINSKDKNYLYTGSTSTGITYGISGTSYNTGPSIVNVTYASTQTTNSAPISYNLPSGSTITQNIYAADLEYYQVVTAITVSEAALIWNTGSTQSFANILNEPTNIDYWMETQIPSGGAQWTSSLSLYSFNALEKLQNYSNQVILILQRGVDPYSPTFENKYGIGKLLGYPNEDDIIVRANTRLNVPVQALNTTSISVQPFSNQNDIFYSSYFFRPGIVGSSTIGLQFSSYTTNNIGYYGSIDVNNLPVIVPSSSLMTSGNKLISNTFNGFYSITTNSSKYDNAEDVSGISFMSIQPYNATPISGLWPTNPINLRYYYTKAFTPSFTMGISNPVKNVMRTDRLPTSDNLDGIDWNINPSILQQNLNFAMYFIVRANGGQNAGYGAGASQVGPDLDGQPYEGEVLASFSCPGMAPLDCYEGFGSTFQVKTPCNDPLGTGYNFVKNGCYILFHNPLNLLGFIDDWKIWGEWGYRFRFMYGLCRGVLSQTFTNNWVNGSLYMFPIQVDTFYNTQNKPKDPIFPKNLVYFDKNTTNFYFRSSPYNINTKQFVGRLATDSGAVNVINLMFPTTLINLGFKDIVYSEIVFDPSTKAYILPELNPTSYGDTSDLVNLFVISRMVDAGFIAQIISFANDSIGTLFSRPNGGSGVLGFFTPKARVDGDFVQLCSINSEVGNIDFSPEFYATTPTNSPTNVLGSAGNPVMAVWFSSTTQDIQMKDYLTPGRINFRTPDNTANYPYPYGIKSQVVPHYQWELRNNTNNLIFGSQLNNWATNSSDIVQNVRYQSLDRTFLGNPNYFRPTTSSINDLYARGYIFSVDASGQYTESNAFNATGNKFIVGAPFHFYFGTVKGRTALDIFKTKYSVSE